MRKSKRERLLTELEDLLERLGERPDPSLVLSDRASRLAYALGEESRHDLDTDLVVLHALGWWHWYRYLCLPEGQGQQDLDAALTLLEPVHQAEVPLALLGVETPWTVPAPLREYFEANQQGKRKKEGKKKKKKKKPSGSGDLAEAGHRLLEQALASSDPENLEDAVNTLERAVTPDHPDHARSLGSLALALGAGFERTGDPADLDRAIEIGQKAIAATPVDHPARAVLAASLGDNLSSRYKLAGQATDLDQAIELVEQAIGATPPGNSLRARYLSALGDALRNRARATDTGDLDRAVEALEQAVTDTALDDSGRARSLGSLGLALAERFELTGELSDLDRAIQAGRDAVAGTSPDHPDHSAWLSNLGLALQTRFARTGHPADLDQAILASQDAVAATPADHPSRAAIAVNLGRALQTRFELTGELVDLDQAIKAGQDAAAADPDRAEWLSDLCTTLQDRYMRTGEMATLDRAIQAGQDAVAATPADHPDRARELSHLGLALRARFVRTGELADLDRAVQACQDAVAATPPEHSDHAGWLSNLAATLLVRFERTGNEGDLEQAIRASQEAVDATSSKDRHPAAIVANLGNGLVFRFERTGSAADLNRAVDLYEEAVAATPDEHTDRAMYLSNLGNALRARSRPTELGDLDRAVEVLKRAVAATPPNHPERAMRLSNLGLALHARYVRTGHSADLDRAIQAGQDAVDATPADHPQRAGWLSNLGLALRARFNSTGELADLDRAIQAGQDAVAGTPTDHPDHAMYGSNLAAALRDRFAESEDRADLERAISAGEEAANATPADHPERTARLSDLGLALLIQADSEPPEDRPSLTRAIAAFRDAAEVEAAPPMLRVLAADSWGRAAGLAVDWPSAVKAFETAIALLGRLASRRLARADQEARLAQLSGIGSQAAAACLQAAERDPQNAVALRRRAVELFEQGRAVLFARTLETRSDLTELAQAAPELAEQFTALVATLDQPTQPNALIGRADPSDASRRRAAEARLRWDAAAQLEETLDRIRELDGFSKFLLPPPLEDLQTAAAEGPVVCVNIAETRSDALILTTDGVDTVPLPEAAPEAIRDQATTLLYAVAAGQDQTTTPTERETAERTVLAALAWLWDAVAGPVLDRLGITGRPPAGGRWPRAYWCPSGLLAFLPLHAAGHHPPHPDPYARTVLDRVVPSITPTIRALSRAHTSPATTSARVADGRILVVAMPETPDQSDLPGAIAEATFLAERYPDQVDILGLPNHPEATHDTVLAALPTHQWAHFSCHGAADVNNPTASHLLLTDHAQHPLTVLDLAHARLPDPTLAFLSACTTARTGTRLPDEPIHLAAACRLAGYQHVIATLWPIRDRDATLVTRGFYRALTTTADPAAALHEATRALLANHPSQPSRWAAHTHTGP